MIRHDHTIQQRDTSNPDTRRMETLIRPRRHTLCLGSSVFNTPPTTFATFGTPIVSIVAAMRRKSAFGQRLEKGTIGEDEGLKMKQMTEHLGL